MAQAIQNNPEIGAVLQGYQQGDYDGLLNSQAALQALADSTGVSVDVIITRITQELRAKGATDGQLVTIDGDISNRKDVIKTTAHELDHVRGGSSETLANFAGIAADLNVSASMDANQDEIDKYKPALGDGRDAVTQAENKQLIDTNDDTLIKAYVKNPQSFDYDKDNWTYNGNKAASTNAEMRALASQAKAIFPNSTADQAAFIKGKGHSVGSSIVKTGKSLAEFVDDPKSAITNSFRGMINVLTDPNKAGQYMRAAIIQWKSDYNNAIKNNPRLAGQMRGELEEAVGFGVATTVIGGTSANALKAMQKTGKLKAVEQKKVDAQKVSNNATADSSTDYSFPFPNKTINYEGISIKVPQNNYFSESSMLHTIVGDFQKNGRMTGGGHTQDNIKYLESKGIDYNIVETFPNGVRVGNIPSHKSSSKSRSGARGQAWFPENWNNEKIAKAAEAVYQRNQLNTGEGPFFANYSGVRVGIYLDKNTRKVATVFPDGNIDKQQK